MRAPLCIAVVAAAALACGGTGTPRDLLDGGASDPVHGSTDRPPSSWDNPGGGGGSGGGGVCTCPAGEYACGNATFQLTLQDGMCVAPLVVSFDPCGNTFSDLGNQKTGTWSKQGDNLVFCEGNDCTTCTPVVRQP